MPGRGVGRGITRAVGRGTTRAEDAQGTPTQSHTSPSILVYEDSTPPLPDRVRVVHLVRSTCHAISGRGDKSTRILSRGSKSRRRWRRWVREAYIRIVLQLTDFPFPWYKTDATPPPPGTKAPRLVTCGDHAGEARADAAGEDGCAPGRDVARGLHPHCL